MTACRIRVNRDTPTSGAFEWATLGEDGRVLASGTANLRQSPVRGRCDVVIASDMVLLEQAAVPAAQRQRLASALRYLVEDSTISDPERQHVVAASTPAKDSLHLAMIDRDWMEKMLSSLEGSGLVARSAYPECLLPGLLPGTWTVVCNGDDSFARTGETEGFSLDRAQAQDAPVALRLAVENARKAGAAPESIIARAAAGIAPPDIGRWSAALGIPVEAGPTWQWASAHSRPRLDLLQGQFSSRAAGGPWRQRLRVTAILAAALLVVGSSGIAIDWGAKAHERRSLMAEMNALYRETFGERAVLVDPPLQMNRALAELRRQAGQVGPADFLALLGRAAEQLLDPQKHRLESIAYERGTLSVTLRPLDLQRAEALLAELRARTSLPGLDVSAEGAGPGGSITLRLRAKPGAGS